MGLSTLLNPLMQIIRVTRASFSNPICLGTTELNRKVSAPMGIAMNKTIFRIILVLLSIAFSFLVSSIAAWGKVCGYP